MRTWGSADARPVVYWHGLGYSGPASLELRGPGQVLASHGLYVVAFDVPGFGGSPAVDDAGYHPHALAAIVPQLLDSLELDRAAVMGFSWGGHIACHVAARHPERVDALVLLDSGYRDPWYDATVSFEERLAESERARAAERAPTVAAAVVAAAVYGISQSPPSTTWPEIARSGLPTLLVVPGDAPADQVARFTEAVPQAVVHRVEGAGHNVLPGAAAHVGEWLRDTPNT